MRAIILLLIVIVVGAIIAFSSGFLHLTQTQSAQEACLRQFVADLAKVGPQRLVIEQDESLLMHDQTALYAAVPGRASPAR